MAYKANTSLSSRITHATKQVIVPHRHNDYRPHLIRTSGIVAMLFIIGIFQSVYNISQTGSVLGRTTHIETRELLDETNATRIGYGAQPLQYSTKLAEAAELKAKDMFTNQYWAHTSPSGTTPWAWLETANYSYQNAGENLAKDFHSTGGVMTAWLDSTEHRENILDARYSEVGFAVVSGVLDGEETTLVVAMYGSPAGQALGRQTSTAPAQGNLSPIARIGVGMQSLSPVALGSIAVLLLAGAVALLSHGYRRRLPHSWQRSWRQHHGFYKSIGMASLAIVVVALYGGGQI